MVSRRRRAAMPYYEFFWTEAIVDHLAEQDE
jgi:hypothetical protein